MIDAHCHLNASYNADTVQKVIERFIQKSGKYIVDVTTNKEELAISQQIISTYPKVVFANIGVHPERVDGTEIAFKELLNELTIIEQQLDQLHNVVGIGETGLDFHYFADTPDLEKNIIDQQRELFVAHLQLAKKQGLPITIHARGREYADLTPYTEVLRIVEQEKFPYRVYFHSYGGDYQLAKQVIDRGYVLGINGIVTYSGAKNVVETVEKIPIEFLLLETDSPYLIPSNLDRKELDNPKVNEPVGIFSTAKRVATLKKSHEQEILEKTAENTRMFFAKIL